MLLKKIWLDYLITALLNRVVKGLSKTPGDPWDNVFAEDIVNHLFEEKNKPGSGSDLVALNIQRGRDHGIPGYNALRELCGKPKANNFDDLSDTMVPGKQLKLKGKFFLTSTLILLPLPYCVLNGILC